MRVVIQRVRRASVAIEGREKASIGPGLLILLGIEEADTKADIDWLCRKLARLRIFNDREGVMNESITDVGGECLVVSQFTLHALTKKGNRPSYIRAASPDTAIPLYETFVETLRQATDRPVETGTFGADMQVELVNDGPVTIIMDTRQRDF